VDGLAAELDTWRADNQTGVEVEPWLDALDEYLACREDSGRVEGWAALWPAQPSAPEAAAEDDEAIATALLDRLNAAAVTTLGQVATVVGGTVAPPDESLQRDDFSWVDAAEWRPAEIALHDHEERRYPAADLDELFAEAPDEQVGSVDELGWYGLLKHQNQPGGLILIQDEQGFRRVREAPTDDALQVQWAAIQAEYEDFHGQRDAYELATAEAAGSPSGLNTRIWVGSLADYNAGRLHGVWLDATLDPDELYQAIQFMVRNGYTPDAEEWGIFDHDEFGGFEVSEYADLKTVSRVAQGVAAHGPAYTAWVELVGADSEELLTEDSFRDHYEGEFESTADYVEYFLQETDFYGQLEEALSGIPEDLRRYVKIDVEGIAEEWGQGLHVVETGGGKVWVFDGRT
jgi:antirestriction protein